MPQVLILSVAQEQKILGDFIDINIYIKKNRGSRRGQSTCFIMGESWEMPAANCHLPLPVIAHTIKTFSQKIHP